MPNYLITDAEQSRWKAAQRRRTTLSPSCALLGIVLLSGTALGCGPASESGKAVHASQTQPSPVQATLYYAQKMAQGVRFTTASSRQYGNGTVAAGSDSSSFVVVLTDYAVDVHLDSEHRPRTVFISVYHPAPATPGTAQNPPPYPAPPDQLVPLGDLRRVFGQGKPGPVMAVKHARWQKHPVLFSYQPAPSGKTVRIRATMPGPDYADSAMVHDIMVSAYER